MRIGLIDVDNREKLNDCFPNLPLMKISAWHKKQGDEVFWYDPMFSGHCDKVYMSKIFSFTPDYEYFIDADEVIKGGSGYCISLVNGKEVFDKSKDIQLPYEIEHIMPDYSLYGITDTAYGFMSRGCPRGCEFCHTGAKDGLKAHQTTNLSEFWSGQKNIVLLDQNILACRTCNDMLQQLIDSKSYVEFNGGLDIRLMTEEKAKLVRQIKVKLIHFAYDRIQDQKYVEPKLIKWTEEVGRKYNRSHVVCYVLCGFKEKRVLEEDLHRIYFLKELGINPYVMLYDKDNIPKGHELRKLQRYVNNKFVFWSCPTFEDYMKEKR